MALPRIGVCHAPGGAANTRELFVAARGLCDVVLLVRAPVAAANPELVGLAGRLFAEHRVLPAEPGAGDLAGLDLRAVTTFHDDELDTADALDAAVRGVDPAPSPWDKLRQREVLAAAGLGGVAAVAVDSPADLVAGFDRLGGLPCVLKPRRAAGGDGVAFLDDAAAARAHRRRQWSGLVLERRIDEHPHPAGDPWLGPMVSVETVTSRGRRTHLVVIDKFPVAVGRGQGPHGTDAVGVQGDILPSKLPPERVRAAEELTGRALDALGVGSRVTHTELRLTPDGFEVLEVNGRLAGYITRLLRLVDGPDMVRAALVAALDKDTAEFTPVRFGGRAAAGLLPVFGSRAGVVRSTVDRRALQAVPGVVAIDELAAAGAQRSETDYRVANLTLAGADRAELDGAVERALGVLSEAFADDLAADGETAPEGAVLRPQGSV
ncbi:ATP-grasp domain-containing protein [Actinokineospora sp. G85]|uniref:ATP-grasp domain-containing protein n=1 Tax=Actinokineospora sp. G85 TaxID=3406626 RepID=UPI003C78B9FF